jgi:AcrR family transcriptional regulator
MHEALRWFGPDDGVTLAAIRQTGATAVFTSLHEIPYGEAWPAELIASRRDQIETRIAEALHELLNSGMSWREVTVEKIAAAAGIKRTLFYVYYPDRAAVLIRLGEELVDSSVTAISDHFLVTTDGIDGIREELLRFIEMMRAYRPFTKALMEGSGVDESVEKFCHIILLKLENPGPIAFSKEI